MSSYYTKRINVRSHTRFDPRIKKRVSVGEYPRNQRYRSYKGIPRDKAVELFNMQSNRSRAIDKSRTSKTVFEVPNEYWVKYMGRSDVKGIDTKSKPSPKNFYEDYYESGSKEKEIREVESQILRCEHEINYFETYHKSAINDPYGNTLKDKYNQWKEELKENQENLKKLEFIWQKEPSKWYWHEEDPRYSKMKKNAEEDIQALNGQIFVLKKKIEDPYVRTHNKMEYAEDIEKKAEQKEILEEKLNKLKENPKNLYWNDKLIEETIKRSKKLPYAVKKVMPEKYQQKYEYMRKRVENIEKAKSKYQETKTERKRVKREAIERERKQDVQKLKAIKEIMKNQFKSKIERESFEDWEISEISDGRKGIMDPGRFTLLMTNSSFKGSVLDKGTKKRQDTSFDIEKTPFRLSRGGDKFYDFKLKNGSEIWFSKEQVDRAVNSFTNPRVYIDKEEARPMIIQDDTYAYAIAPRIDVDDPEWWDEKSLIPGGIHLTPKGYKEKMKMTKAEMINKGNLDKDLQKKSKDYLLYEYLEKQKGKV